MMSENLLSQAIISIRSKTPLGNTPSKVFAPDQQHKFLYPLLEIWDADAQDPDIEDKAKFIYNFLTDENSTARDKIIGILGEIPPISSQPTIERIYKYCRLKDEYRKTITRAEMLNQKLRGI
jgi:hypothetical protein